jgi:glycosyltransferase involved in cell wall biosynthesis
LKLLFVTWDGPQVHYLESLFLPIFERLAEYGVRVDILQFRWGSEAEAEAVGKRCAKAGCGYRHVTIRRGLAGLGPFATALAGSGHVRRAVAECGSDAVMRRSRMPARAGRAAGGAGLRPILFDADGLAADERVDFAGLSPRGPTYRILRQVEARTVRASASVLVRSPAAAQILQERSGCGLERFHIVANGRDEKAFHPFDEAARQAARESLGIAAGAPVVVYAGSVGPQYRFDLIRDFAEALAKLRPDGRLLVLSGSPEAAKAELAGASLAPIFLRAAPEEVPRYLAAADLGLAFRADSFSMQGVSPVKLGEYLLCGVPALGNSMIGDTSGAIADGVFMDDRMGPDAAARWLVEDILPRREDYRARARTIATEVFSLSRSVEDYLRAIQPVERLSH